jgi:hypothetical protein
MLFGNTKIINLMKITPKIYGNNYSINYINNLQSYIKYILDSKFTLYTEGVKHLDYFEVYDMDF